MMNPVSLADTADVEEEEVEEEEAGLSLFVERRCSHLYLYVCMSRNIDFHVRALSCIRDKHVL